MSNILVKSALETVASHGGQEFYYDHEAMKFHRGDYSINLSRTAIFDMIQSTRYAPQVTPEDLADVPVACTTEGDLITLPKLQLINRLPVSEREGLIEEACDVMNDVSDLLLGDKEDSIKRIRVAVNADGTLSYHAFFSAMFTTHNGKLLEGHGWPDVAEYRSNGQKTFPEARQIIYAGIGHMAARAREL